MCRWFVMYLLIVDNKIKCIYQQVKLMTVRAWLFFFMFGLI